MIALLLDGKKEAARAVAPKQPTKFQIASMPSLKLTTLDGKPVTSASLDGKVVLVEFWATWCPPCRGTLSWLGDLKKKHGDKLAVVAVSVESDDKDVQKLTKELNIPVLWTSGSPELARSFGDISAVPTLFIFDRTGKTAGVFYGAPPTLHKEAEALIARVATTTATKKEGP
jgi:thiol-disulfide isomerase/thioredoxin